MANCNLLFVSNKIFRYIYFKKLSYIFVVMEDTLKQNKILVEKEPKKDLICEKLKAKIEFSSKLEGLKEAKKKGFKV